MVWRLLTLTAFMFLVVPLSTILALVVVASRSRRCPRFELSLIPSLLFPESIRALLSLKAGLTMDLRKKTIAVIGLGYVGLPLAVAFGKIRTVIGFDVQQERIAELRSGIDRTREVEPEELVAARYLTYTTALDELNAAEIFIVAVPTPIDQAKRPDITLLRRASETVGKVIRPGGVVIFELTVYPGCTRNDCVPIIERESGLVFNRDFFAGYSPERINPGDKAHRLHSITKVTSGSTPDAADAIDELYGEIVTAGTHKAASIEVAEAAKVIENTQRDLNIALMNELAIIFYKLNIDTQAVLAAAGTKWNFLPSRPGLVGGHCIGVDPYYLTHRAQEIGYHPDVILAGRRINDGMGIHIADRVARPDDEPRVSGCRLAYAGDGSGLQRELPGRQELPRD